MLLPLCVIRVVRGAILLGIMMLLPLRVYGVLLGKLLLAIVRGVVMLAAENLEDI